MKTTHRTLGTLGVTAGAMLFATSSALAQFDTDSPLDREVRNALSLTDYEVAFVDVPGGLVDSFETSISFDGFEYTLDLHHHSMRAPNYQAYTIGLDGEKVAFDAPAPMTYRGTVEGIEGSVVAASLTEGGITAVIALDPDTMIEVMPMTQIDDARPMNEHVVFDPGTIELPDFSCGVDDHGHDHAHKNDQHFGGGETDALKFCEIALDADVEFYNKNGNSVPNTIADMEDIMNGVDVIYQRDTEIGYIITATLVRTSEPDPYSSTDPGTLLTQFRNHWNSQQGGIQRDVAHLFTGKNINGGVIGIAYLSVICNIGSAYGLSESRFTSNRTSRIGLTAHELGHNWSAPHCDGNGDCRIMCSGLGGCNRDLTRFGAASITRITNFKNSRGCLDDEPGFTLVSDPVPPLQGETFVDFVVTGGTPNISTALFYSTKGTVEGGTEVSPGIFVDLRQPKLISVKSADSNGDATWTIFLPNVTLRVFLQAVQSDASLTNWIFADIE